MRVRVSFGVALCLAVVSTGAVMQSFDRLPPGWHRVGLPQFAEDYFIQLDSKTRRGGTTSLRIRSTRPDARSFTGVTQAVSAEPYRGTRVRLRGYARVSGVSRWAGLWMRIDGPTVVPFDNMHDRPFVGTADWRSADVVLDVPADADAIYIGGLLSGSGTLWIDEFEFDTVPQSVPTTGAPRPSQTPVTTAPGLPRVLTNLGFEPEK
jgi:hypothetical protein